MPGHDGAQFNRKFIGGGSHIVLRKVEKPDRGVPIQSVYDVAGPLVRNIAVGDVEVLQVRPVVDHVSREQSTGQQGKDISRQVQVREHAVHVNVADHLFQGVGKLDGSEKGQLEKLFWLIFHQSGQRDEETRLAIVTVDNDILDARIHKYAECDSRPDHILHLIRVEFHFVEMHHKRNQAG